MAEVVTIDRAKLLLRHAMEDMVTELATETLVRVRRRTPIKTGFARSRWDMTPKRFTLGRSIAVLNDCGYIDVLEDGHSRQAPHGFLKLTLAELPYIAREIARKYRGRL